MSENHKHLKWPLMVLAIFLAIYLGVLTRNELRKYDYIGRTDQQIYTINISGRGEITAKPDIAQISLGVETENKDVAVAQKENSTKMNLIIGELKKLGIAEDDLKTSNYNIYPLYDYTSNRQVLRGYQVSNSVLVKIRDLEKVTDILALAGQNGANQIGGLSFTIDDPEELKQQARELALLNAKNKAEALAKVAGVKLGKLVSFNENFDGGSPVAYRSFAVEDSAGFGGGGEPVIQPGDQDIVVNVNVTYEVL